MADAKPAPEEGAGEPKKKSKLPLLLGAVLAVVLGGGSFFAVWSGMILAPSAGGEHAAAEPEVEPMAETEFVALTPMVLSVGAESRRHLRFTASVEVGAARREEVEHLMPRILDVLNSYLRAVDARDLEDPTALVRLRSQMLRRVQVVTGEGRVRDLLITEFVLS
ncbi:flagellar basal body-associated FliL family protein [Frigidibacter sp. MR17.14]|uniref:flagellar basal body-associated FliL family protein n=1 Tax=Frigidibacter sp. MR17.14 TaxID=3126509 RepID=UPI003012C212